MVVVQRAGQIFLPAHFSVRILQYLMAYGQWICLCANATIPEPLRGKGSIFLVLQYFMANGQKYPGGVRVLEQPMTLFCLSTLHYQLLMSLFK
jgi:hypothetical protein